MAPKKERIQQKLQQALQPEEYQEQNNLSKTANMNNVPNGHLQTTSTKPDQSSPLDPFHTHFVLVDNPDKTGYGGEIEYRALLEQKIRKPREKSKSSGMRAGYIT